MTLLKRTLFCVFDVMQSVCGLRFKKHYFPHTVHYCCSSMLCLSETHRFLAHRSEKQGVLWLASYPVRCDWPNTSSVRRKCVSSFIAYTFGRCFANLPTPWRRRGGVFEWAVLGRRDRVLSFIKNISETLVFATSGILSMHKQIVTLQRERKLEITSYDPFNII